MCCSDPSVDPPEEGGNNEPLSPEKADAIMETFSFISAAKVTGNLPSVSNTTLTKTSSRDTIYTLPGVRDVLRISHPESRIVKGVYFAVSGSTFYYNVEIERRESTDTVGITYFDIDPVKINDEISDGSTSLPVDIIPYDESNQPIDIIERVMTIEKPGDACNILNHTWFWQWSMLTDPTGHPYNLNTRGERNMNEYIFKDCCLGVPACPVYDENQDPIYDVEIPISLYYTIVAEWFRFHSDGTFDRQTREQESYISNPGDDPYTFDPCSWTPEIDHRMETVNYWGTHDYAPGDNVITYLATGSTCPQGEIGCGYAGSVSNAQLITTCHVMAVIKGSEGGKSVKLLARGSSSESDVEQDILDMDRFWE
ncbi:hypothetical protein DQQ10_15600 [Pseudochryseolinea flava]|uniref:Uncharacterized protein n=2 Tax=Pseudochryseolinea flava TaxID=2059302 RepID=A0A364Y121_9BACT|nr:hypothetical protein DQQ10_15600 [Pseudochryseolinea flava]